MFISVDIERIRAHCTILQAEQREADALTACLANYRQAASDAGLTEDTAFWEKQLQIIRDQKRYIQGRISLLEQMLEQFTKLKHETAECLKDASSQMNYLTTIFGNLS